jgi:integrase
MVMPSGHASYVLTYGPTRKRIKLGDVGVVRLADARAEAKLRLSRYQLGLEKETGSSKFETACAEFLAASVQKGNRARTTKDYTRLLTRHFSGWNNLRLDEITAHDLERRIARIAAVSERRHAYDAIKVFMRWAERRHYIDRALTDRIDPPAKGRSRNRILTDDELRAVWLAADGTDHFSRIIRLCILTGQRRSEMAHLERDMIRGDRIVLPADLSKNRQEHAFPIGPIAQAILAELLQKDSHSLTNGNRRLTSDYVFPARKTWRGGGLVYNAWNKDKPRLDKRSGITGWVIHDLRRTFRSKWAELGISREVAERYINHISGVHSGVSGVYDRFSYWQPMEQACAKWERFLSNLIARG